MKNQFFTLFIAIMALLQFSVLDGKTQTRSACIPENGYWVLVSNLQVKKVTTVQFYNNDNQLIYEEVVRNRKMDLKHLKTLRCLKRGLDSALVAWNLQKKAIYNKDWVAMNFEQ